MIFIYLFLLRSPYCTISYLLADIKIRVKNLTSYIWLSVLMIFISSLLICSGTKWPCLCWWAGKKLLTHSLPHCSVALIGWARFNVPLDTVQDISETMFLQVRWPNQQCQSTEGGWLVIQIALNLTRLLSPCYNNTTRMHIQDNENKHTKKSKHSEWTQWDEAKSGRLNLSAAPMIVQLQEATQYYYYRAVLATFPLTPDQIRAECVAVVAVVVVLVRVRNLTRTWWRMR